MSTTSRLATLGLNAGKKTRLHRILYDHGVGNGTALFLGGKDSFYAVDYAARVASELGADMVKVTFPHPEKRSDVKSEYDARFTGQEAIDAVVRSASRTMLLVSGGEKADDDTMLTKARQSMEAGATGLIFGRNVWQRPRGESFRFAERLREILAKYPRL